MIAFRRDVLNEAKKNIEMMSYIFGRQLEKFSIFYK